MRNYITPDHCALSDALTEAQHLSSVANSNRRLEVVHNERWSDADGASLDLPSKVVPPSSDFEGFGSFSG
jgi:hypothetical protein